MHAQITQSNRFAISLQCRKKELSEVYILHADKRERLLQIDSMILMGMVKHSQSPKIASLQCFHNISKNKLKMKLIFCMEINICKVDIIIVNGHDQAFQNFFTISQKRS